MSFRNADRNEIPCTSCIKGNNIDCSKENSRVSEKLQLIHSDLRGTNMKTSSIAESRYLLTLIENFTRKVFVYFLEKRATY